jgi:ribosomal protein S27AE
MASILRIHCDRCDLSYENEDMVIFAVCDDGSEAPCWHPAEFDYAQEATGHTWEELKSADRLRPRSPWLCLRCGEAGYYGAHADVCEGVLLSSGGLIPPYKVMRSQKRVCAACGAAKLYPVCNTWHAIGCHLLVVCCFVGAIMSVSFLTLAVLLLLVWGLSRLRMIQPVCPRCGRGRLWRQTVGIS